MSSRFGTALLVVVLLGAPSARAASACTGPEIAAEAEVVERWPGAVDAIRKHVATLDELDRCARIDLVAGTKDIVVIVTLRDGRSTIRRAARVEDLPEVVEALLILPAAPASEPKADEPVPAPKKPSPPPIAPPPKVAARPAPTKSGFEIGVGGSERAAGAPLHVGFGFTMHAHLTYGAWHVGVSARSDGINAPARNENGDSVFIRSTAIGVVTGRRLSTGSFDVDLIGGAALVAQTQDLVNDDRNEGQFSPRMTTTARLSQSGARVRVFVAGDFELGYSGRAKGPPPPFVSWPFWSFGVTIGVLWSNR